MINRRKFRLYFLRFGKIKGSIIYFVFCIAACTLLLIIHSAVFYKINDHSFITQITKNLHLAFIWVIFFGYKAWRFYDNAVTELNEFYDLQKRGLSYDDISRIEFTKDWQQIRQKGILKYCLFDSGLMLCIVLLIPLLLLSILVIFSTKGTFVKVDDLPKMLLSIAIAIYFITAVIYFIRWRVNEKKFQRLTDPLY